jgi:two-component system nitrate/nitrite response regulator NarL
VKVHVKHILRKLELRSRVEAAVWAVEHLRM